MDTTKRKVTAVENKAVFYESSEDSDSCFTAHIRQRLDGMLVFLDQYWGMLRGASKREVNIPRVICTAMGVPILDYGAMDRCESRDNL